MGRKKVMKVSGQGPLNRSAGSFHLSWNQIEILVQARKGVNLFDDKDFPTIKSLSSHLVDWKFEYDKDQVVGIKVKLTKDGKKLADILKKDHP